MPQPKKPIKQHWLEKLVTKISADPNALLVLAVALFALYQLWVLIVGRASLGSLFA